MSERHVAKQAFLDAAGWGRAQRVFLAGDASDRTYDRLLRGADRAICMDAPPGQADDVETFVRIAQHLARIGLSVPTILACDTDQGFALLEDFGDASFATILTDDHQREPELYMVATDALLHLQRSPVMPELANLSAAEWTDAATSLLACYTDSVAEQPVALSDIQSALCDAMSLHADGPRAVIHRDYHAENLMWLPDREGMQRAGVLDFQLMQLGQPCYDLVSLLQDARRDVHADTETNLKRHFCTQTGQTEKAFGAAYAVVGAQRALRIIGIFARLCVASGKQHYISLIPRVWAHLQTNLAHPQLHGLAVACARFLPKPTDANLLRLRQKCAMLAK